MDHSETAFLHTGTYITRFYVSVIKLKLTMICQSQKLHRGLIIQKLLLSQSRHVSLTQFIKLSKDSKDIEDWREEEVCLEHLTLIFCVLQLFIHTQF